MMCSWHSIKRTETSGVKMVSTKTSRDVGVVPLSSSCMEKPTGGKSIGTRRGIPWHSNNPGQHLSASRHSGYILHHQSLHLATFDLPSFRLLLQASATLTFNTEGTQFEDQSTHFHASTLMCLTAQFTIMHQVMQGTCIQCKSSLWPCIHHSMCVYVRNSLLA